MITRYAIFGGTVKTGKKQEMREWVTANLTPLWRKFNCAEEVRIVCRQINWNSWAYKIMEALVVIVSLIMPLS